MNRETSGSVLITDDSATMRMLLVVTLKKAFPGLKVKEAADADEALDLLRKNKFDLVVSDVDMPGMDGVELAGKIREEFGDALPVIMVTTKGKEEDIERAMKAGANGYITKPIDSVKLKETISSHLN